MYSKTVARANGERWKVEWCEFCPTDECGDADIDNAKMVNEYFHSREEAVARIVEIEAKRLDFFGDPTMTRERFKIDWTDPETGRDYWHWTASNHDVWRVHDGEVWQ